MLESTLSESTLSAYTTPWIPHFKVLSEKVYFKIPPCNFVSEARGTLFRHNMKYIFFICLCFSYLCYKRLQFLTRFFKWLTKRLQFTLTVLKYGWFFVHRYIHITYIQSYYMIVNKDIVCLQKIQEEKNEIDQIYGFFSISSNFS